MYIHFKINYGFSILTINLNNDLSVKCYKIKIFKYCIIYFKENRSSKKI